MEEKKARLRDLNNINFPSDEEFEEKQRLYDEIALMRKDPTEKPREKVVIPEQVEAKKPREHSAFGKLVEKGIKIAIDHFKEKPVTEEELRQLKLKAMKYKYLESIAKSKAGIRKAKANRFNNISSSQKKSRSRYSYDDTERSVARLLDDSVGRSGRRPVFSESDKNIRKAFGI